MLDDEPRREFWEYVRAVCNEIDGPLGPCPGDAELFEYRAGRLDPRRCDEIQSHVVRCRSCRETVLDAAVFLEASPAKPDLQPQWNRLRRQLTPQVSRRWQSQTLPLTAAAALFITTALTTVWAMRLNSSLHSERSARDGVERQTAALRDEIAVLRQRDTSTFTPTAPLVNPGVFDLLPSDSVSRSAGAFRSNSVTVVPGRPFLLLLSAAGQPVYPSYRVEVLDARGGTKWSAEGLRRDQQSNYSILLSPGFLSAGDYRIQVAGVRGGSSTLLGTYRFRLVTQSASPTTEKADQK
jgi:hypothetical protein